VVRELFHALGHLQWPTREKCSAHVWDEAARLATPSGRVSIDGSDDVSAGELQSVLRLAREAFAAGDGEIPDDRVRESGLAQG
jgi:hypothetical protein